MRIGACCTQLVPGPDRGKDLPGLPFIARPGGDLPFISRGGQMASEAAVAAAARGPSPDTDPVIVRGAGRTAGLIYPIYKSVSSEICAVTHTKGRVTLCGVF